MPHMQRESNLGSMVFTEEVAAPIEAEESAGWLDAVNVSEETLRELLKTDKPLRFDWENKWLRGDQYAHMLNKIDAYREAFGMHKMGEKQHPENIYLEPMSKFYLKLLISVGMQEVHMIFSWHFCHDFKSRRRQRNFIYSEITTLNKANFQKITALLRALYHHSCTDLFLSYYRRTGLLRESEFNRF